MRRTPHLAKSVDDSILIIEDEHGELVYHQGNLSFLMPNKPKLDKVFCHQLNADIVSAYSSRQIAVWDLGMPDLGVFRSKCGRNGLMFPMSVLRQRYTYTVFLHAAQ